MNHPLDTPRLRSAFPTTPQSNSRNLEQYGSPITKLASSLPDITTLAPNQDTNGPLIPFDIIDAPSQRFYVAGFYTALIFWRFYDFYKLTVDENESLWLFMKWVAIDGVFLFGLPGLRIPWLEWSSMTMTLLFLLHAFLNGILMFRISIPLEAGLVALTKLLYDRELAVAERRVKPANIWHNSSLILGKQIIHILPEGSALLNPNQEAFCLDTSSSFVDLPIQINQTSPISIELLRFDLDTSANETISIPASQIKKLLKAAEKGQRNHDPANPRLLEFRVKKTGMYTLQRVVDESKLEVQRRISDTLVVACPQARIKSPAPDRCRGELSDLTLEVEGTPPLRVKYRKVVNGEDREMTFQSIQPDDFISPLSKQSSSQALVSRDNTNIFWARSHQVKIPLNEVLAVTGQWQYIVDEVQDALGNSVDYAAKDHETAKIRKAAQQEIFTVHERPRVALQGCDSGHSIKVAKGKEVELPVQYNSTGKSELKASQHTLLFVFTRPEDLGADGEHKQYSQPQRVTVKNTSERPVIKEPGLYTLQSVSSQYCAGEVLEPSSCLLENPPEPDLSITYDQISDKCAGNPIGFRLALNLIGTPPFHVQWSTVHNGVLKRQLGFRKIFSLRDELELVPEEAGHYTYSFNEISDAVYAGRSLKEKRLILEADFQPAASASFTMDTNLQKQACLDEPVSFDVNVQGARPFTLEYELIHGDRRRRYEVYNVTDSRITITTERLTSGGEYTLNLAGITDRLGCKELLNQEAKIFVRHQRPKAAFGQLEGKRAIRTLEGKQISLPIRLTGEAPWVLSYRNRDVPAESQKTVNVRSSNSFLDVTYAGTYEITHVHDVMCPGSVDEGASAFEVQWIKRPSLGVAESSSISMVGDKHMKNDVCEGDQDVLEINLSGTPPYEVKYVQSLKPDHGSRSVRNHQLNVPLGVATIKMETTQAGLCEYKFTELGDYNYDHDPRKYSPVVVEQRINPRPSARFNRPGATYKFCQDEGQGEEVIPMTFTGVPPFWLEVEISHHSSAKPESLEFSDIPSEAYNLRIPHRRLHLGHSNIYIRKVRDARGCQSRSPIDPTTGRVHISVHLAPSILPLDDRTNVCVGDHLSFALTGSAPFNIFYTFEGKERKATVSGNTFRRLAEKPGLFTINSLKDSASDCKAILSPDETASLQRRIHQLPSVRVSKGRESVVDIHEGGEAEILFEFTGTPPFAFTYTRSTNAEKGKKQTVIETHAAKSWEYSMRIKASEEGTYEVTSIKDAYCGFSKEGGAEGKVEGIKRLQY